MKRPAHITFVNGTETSAINIADRGLAYGDGLFETMRVIEGKIPLFDYHLRRFIKGCEVLNLGELERLQKDFKYYVHDCLHEIRDNACLKACILKIIVTRGCGGRGYTPPDTVQCQFVVQVFDLPDYPGTYQTQGVLVKECQYRLPYHPLLAGIKHLNRLDQVVASQELISESEGLLYDHHDNLIEGTKSNILLFKGNRVITPDLEGAGVEGVLRQALIEANDLPGFKLQVEAIKRGRLSEYEGLAMLNSVFGLWPVSEVSMQDGQTLRFHIPKKMQALSHYLQQNYAY